jgi:hypothetical protein
MSKSGVLVYVMAYGNDLTKIGITFDTARRLSRLRKAVRNEVVFVAAYLFGTGTGREAKAAEDTAHYHFAPKHAGLTGFKGCTEIFRITPAEACEYLCRAGGVAVTPEQGAALLIESKARARSPKGEDSME